MPDDVRGFWSGTLTFGLVSIPVELFPAVRSQRPRRRAAGANAGSACHGTFLRRGHLGGEAAFAIALWPCALLPPLPEGMNTLAIPRLLRCRNKPRKHGETQSLWLRAPHGPVCCRLAACCPERLREFAPVCRVRTGFSGELQCAVADERGWLGSSDAAERAGH